MPIAPLIAAFLVGPLQGAPADVPKNHWAHGAVDKLFKEGLLKGYPKQAPLQLDKTLKQDIAKLKAWAREWKSNGWLVGYPDFHRDDDNPYVLAIAVHAMLANLKGAQNPEVADECLRFIKAISMLKKELTELGADTNQMIAIVNDLRDGLNRPFHGNR